MDSRKVISYSQPNVMPFLADEPLPDLLRAVYAGEAVLEAGVERSRNDFQPVGTQRRSSST